MILLLIVLSTQEEVKMRVSTLSNLLLHVISDNVAIKRTELARRRKNLRSDDPVLSTVLCH